MSIVGDIWEESLDKCKAETIALIRKKIKAQHKDAATCCAGTLEDLLISIMQLYKERGNFVNL